MGVIKITFKVDGMETSFEGDENKSLRSDPDDEILIAKNYNELAELNFRNKDYLQAGLYYDSTLSELNSRTRECKKKNRKRENLNE